MHVAIVIVGFRNADDIVACLAALAIQTHGYFSVVICENGGAAAEADLAASVPAVLPDGQTITILSAPGNPGYAGGVNRCLAAAPDADAWWVLNPDTHPAPEALAGLVEEIETGRADVVGGVLLESDGSIASLGGRWSPWLGRMVSIGKHAPRRDLPTLLTKAIDLDYVSGACMLVAHRVVDRIGPMREDYFLYAEEVEWLWRARRAGFRIGVAPGAYVTHHQGSATGSADEPRLRPRLPIYLNARNILNLTRDTGAAPPLAAAVALATHALLKYPRAGAWRQTGYVLQGLWAGLRDERGKPDWLKRPA